MGSSSNNQNDGDNIAVTDNGNYIVDLVFDKPIEDAPAAAAQLKNTCGVVDHGFFIGMTTAVIIARILATRRSPASTRVRKVSPCGREGFTGLLSR